MGDTEQALADAAIDSAASASTSASNWITADNAMIPTLEGQGQWWSPAYYTLIFSTVLSFIIAIYLIVRRFKISFVLIALLVTIINTYINTRTSTCLWKGGCRIFAVLTLLQPILFMLILLFIETVLLGLSLDNIQNNETPPPEETQESTS